MSDRDITTLYLDTLPAFEQVSVYSLLLARALDMNYSGAERATILAELPQDIRLWWNVAHSTMMGSAKDIRGLH